jgi:putative endonuclease
VLGEEGQAGGEHQTTDLMGGRGFPPAIRRRSCGGEMYSTYVLASLKDGKHYIGLSRDPQKRLNEHNRRKVRSTKSRVPFVLVYKEEFSTLGEAREREKFFKTAIGRRYLKTKLSVTPLHP